MAETCNAIGLTGVGLILAEYVLLQMERIASERLVYSLLNLAGAALILISLMSSWNLPSFAVESYWLVISVYGIIKFVRKRAGR